MVIDTHGSVAGEKNKNKNKKNGMSQLEIGLFTAVAVDGWWVTSHR